MHLNLTEKNTFETRFSLNCQFQKVLCELLICNGKRVILTGLDLSILSSKPSLEYPKQLDRVAKKTGFTEAIEETVEAATQSLANGIRSFVIYGEPQSGKTEMMICLTAKLLDDGYKNIVILVNDSVDLQAQNLSRFRRSNLQPSPLSLTDIKTNDALSNALSTVIFCKKNQSDLRILINRMRNIGHRVIIDDEADYATPNSKINSGDQSKINELVEELITADEESVYIGVTATPARLNLNNTFANDASGWCYFRPYPNYSGREVFFPNENTENVEFNLIRLPELGDDPRHLYEAAIRFMVNVAHFNIHNIGEEKNFAMMIHTSGIKNDHLVEKQDIEKFLIEIQDPNNPNFQKRYQQIYEDAASRYSIEPNEIVNYVHSNCARASVKVVNSDAEKNPENLKGATDPESLFTFVIGGNIISRGVTFLNLLSMFFARTAQKLQQDTYVQRARMFGDRTGYLKYFELHIPEKLYVDWHRAFTLLGLSMASIKTGKPVWMEDSKIRAVASNSIDNSTLTLDKGEISFGKFTLTKEILDFTSNTKTGLENFNKFIIQLPENYLSEHIKDFALSSSGKKGEKIIIHASRQLKPSDKDSTIDYEEITRPKGMYGGADYEQKSYPEAVHHFKIFYNEAGTARVIYHYKAPEKIRFMRSRRNSNDK